MAGPGSGPLPPHRVPAKASATSLFRASGSQASGAPPSAAQVPDITLPLVTTAADAEVALRVSLISRVERTRSGTVAWRSGLDLQVGLQVLHGGL